MFKKTLLVLGLIMIFASLFMIVNKEDIIEEDLLDQGDIIEKAKEIGMIFPEELEVIENQVDNMGEDDIINRAKELGMVFVSQSEELELESKEVSIIIPEGVSGREVVRILYDNGLIEDRIDLILLADKLNIANKMMAGKYTFDTGTSAVRILLELTAN